MERGGLQYHVRSGLSMEDVAEATIIYEAARGCGYLSQAVTIRIADEIESRSYGYSGQQPMEGQ